MFLSWMPSSFQHLKLNQEILTMLFFKQIKSKYLPRYIETVFFKRVKLRCSLRPLDILLSSLEVVLFTFFHSIYNRSVKILANFQLWYIQILPGWSGAKIDCTVHVALPKRPTNQFDLVQQSRQHALRAYCPNLYTVSFSFISFTTKVIYISCTVSNFYGTEIDIWAGFGPVGHTEKKNWGRL